MEVSKDSMAKRICIDRSKSPLNFFKKKQSEKDKNKDKISVIKKIDSRIQKMEDLYNQNEVFSKKYEPNAKENMLLKLMYLEDVDSEFVKSEMRVTDKELQYIVNNLLEQGFVKKSSNNEIELTMEGIHHITSNNMDLF